METKVDRFGRVLLPKSLRTDFGLEPGDALRIEEREQGILLTPVHGEPHLGLKDGVLVFTGSLQLDTGDTVKRDRERRIRKLRTGKSR
jgi:AbrB family looped-hinge helix DNA binding protein